ncbi:CECR2-like protein, partial [Mya arenaria]
MDDLRSWWEVPSIAHFCSLFRNAFNLTDFDIEDLEIGLVESEKEEGSEFILDLLCRLLNGCYARKDISGANFDLYVKDIIKYKWEGSDNPIKEKTEFKELTLREKVELILAICEYRLDTEDVVDQLKGLEGDSMRVEPLGKDKDGALYWYFFGIRLYKEDPAPKTEISREEK